MSVWAVRLNALLEACLNKLLQVAVQNRTGVAGFNVGPEILNAGLIENVTSDLVSPADVALTFLKFFLCGHAFSEFGFVKLGL